MAMAYLNNRKFLFSVFVSLLLLFASLVVQFYAGTYATEKVSNPVTDIILSNTPVFNVNGLFVYGTILFWCFISLLCLKKPHRLPFVLKSVALFVLIRSAFISLTHIGPFPEQLVIDSNILSRFVFGGDLFFSGHTGIPFLMALIFWEDARLRVFFISSAVLFGTIVLAAHLHYTIDVAAAFFITYSIHRIAELIFPGGKKLFDRGL